MLPGGDLVPGKRGAVLADGTSGICGACVVPRKKVAFGTSQAPLAPRVKLNPLTSLTRELAKTKDATRKK